MTIDSFHYTNLEVDKEENDSKVDDTGGSSDEVRLLVHNIHEGSQDTSFC